MSKAAAHLGNLTLSLRAATSIAELGPRDPEGLLQAAWVVLALNLTTAFFSKNQSWAEFFAERSASERSDDPNAYRALALAAWRSGNPNVAAQTYARSINQSW